MKKTSAPLRNKNPRYSLIRKILWICIFFVLCFYVSNYWNLFEEPNPPGLVPRALFVIHRHGFESLLISPFDMLSGARTALQHFTFEDFKWDEPLGQLTKTGMFQVTYKAFLVIVFDDQAFELGTRLRELYLPKNIDFTHFPSQLNIVSTYFDRTIETARCVVLGMLHGVRHLSLTSACDCRTLNSPATYACIESCFGISEAEQYKYPLPEIRVLSKNSKEVRSFQIPIVLFHRPVF